MVNSKVQEKSEILDFIQNLSRAYLFKTLIFYVLLGFYTFNLGNVSHVPKKIALPLQTLHLASVGNLNSASRGSGVQSEDFFLLF